jgi:hypothetical protein
MCAHAGRLDTDLGPGRVVDPGPFTGSADVGLRARAAEAPCVFWFLGRADPSAFAQAQGLEGIERIARSLPSNHSPLFTPAIEPTLETGVAALISAARNCLPAPVSHRSFSENAVARVSRSFVTQ